MLNEEEEDYDSLTCDSVESNIKSTLGDELPNGICLGVKLSGAPTYDWVDQKKGRTLFKPGDLVLYKSFDEETEDTIWAMKIVGYGSRIETYYIRHSGGSNDSIVCGYEIKDAPDDAKWESLFDKTDPFKIPGFNISVPSNNYGKRPV